MWIIVLSLLIGLQYLINNKYHTWKIRCLPTALMGSLGLMFVGLSLKEPEGWTWMGIGGLGLVLTILSIFTFLTALIINIILKKRKAI